MSGMKTPYRRLINRGFNSNQDTAALIFERGSSQYETMTPPAGDRRTWFFRFVGKLSALNVLQDILSTSGNSDSTFFDIRLLTDYRLQLGNWTTQLLITSAVFRDPTAEYDIGVAYNTTEGSSANRLGIMLDGEWVTEFDTDNRSSLTLDFQGGINSAIQHAVGRQNQSGGNYLSSICSFHEMISGYIPDTSEIGRRDSAGRWMPKPYSGDHGVSGWLVDHTDGTSTTTLGYDTRPLFDTQTANNWALNNFTTASQVIDRWSNNFCTWNPATTGNLSTNLKDGLLLWDVPGGANAFTRRYGTQRFPEGLSYVEFNPQTDTAAGNWASVGVSSDLNEQKSSANAGTAATEWVFMDNGFLRNNNTPVAYGSAQGSSFFIRMAVNTTTGKVWFGDASGWFGSGDPENDLNPAYSGLPATLFPVGVFYRSAATSQAMFINAGQKDFAYTPPAGAKTLCTANLPRPAKASEVTPLTGSFTGTASANPNFVYLGYTPDQGGTCTINGNAITWGTHAIATAWGFYTITSSASYNASGSNTYSIAVKYPGGGKGIAPAPAQIN